ncbi:phosphatidylserine decarboxylase [Catenovulum agarivorans DS-2]|uniref:Phosphatidylserine decarboxylase proenzyme n=1 Tax=Catenovulum agarivorans DS-2 TaxID=1328313 RepID=W7QLD6_9ALTE|nr:archaetidylserine decarboxylase [Catenovulum agarivorans]EWH09742.1 phosphatidylserine decarboxylase [Catenovulum agarivorans DS-2]
MSLEKFKVALQYVVPQHLISRLVGKLAASQNKFISQTFIRLFAKNYNIQLNDTQVQNFSEFASFNDFFTRALLPDARAIADNDIVSPVDGEVSQLGKIDGDAIFQAKGHNYSLVTLLGGDEENAKPYQNGLFSTIYLSPSDYHRIHMPCTGKLKRMVYVPGKLFSVNQATTRNVDGLFARNERVVCIFDTEFGEMALVLVGAMIVASIETTWAGVITPPGGKRPFTWHYNDDNAPVIEKGQEMGRFKLGSTVVLAFEPQAIEFEDSVAAASKVVLGQALANALK